MYWSLQQSPAESQSPVESQSPAQSPQSPPDTNTTDGSINGDEECSLGDEISSLTVNDAMSDTALSSPGIENGNTSPTE